MTTVPGSRAGGVPVVVYADDTETAVAQTTTDTFGGFQVRRSSLPDGTYRLRIGDIWWPHATTWANAQPLTLIGGTPTTANLVIGQLANMIGTVVDADGDPVEGAAVAATDTTGTTVALATTDTDGAFTLGIITPGDHTMTVTDPDDQVTLPVGGDPATTFTTSPAADLDIGTIDSSTGLLVPPPSTGDVAAITAGTYHTCALHEAGTVSCWGMNSLGQLGNGTTAPASVPTPTPVPVTGITDATAITAGALHTCALHATGTISCWGSNNRGHLGDGTTSDSSTPVTVTGITDATAIAAGGNHTCAIRSTGTISCWGDNIYGQLGSGSTATESSTPLTVTGITDATTITAGALHTCAIRSTGTISCWGYNGTGGLGNGTTTGSSTPVTVTGITDATTITAGLGHTCALRDTGTASCWGSNGDGQLGNGTNASSSTAVAVTGITDATTITAGQDHTCAIRDTGTASCWGNNGNGQLGNDTTTKSSTPVTVTGITDATTITAGIAHSCAPHDTGAASCWGDNRFGQVGNGTTTSSSIPVEVTF